MYRLALVGLLALSLNHISVACPPAQQRIVIRDGQPVTEWYCPEGQVMALIDNVFRCFVRHPACLNGFFHDNVCHCFPGTSSLGPGVCSKICSNCDAGWCSSPYKCECSGYSVWHEGKCVSRDSIKTDCKSNCDKKTSDCDDSTKTDCKRDKSPPPPCRTNKVTDCEDTKKTECKKCEKSPPPPCKKVTDCDSELRSDESQGRFKRSSPKLLSHLIARAQPLALRRQEETEQTPQSV